MAAQARARSIPRAPLPQVLIGDAPYYGRFGFAEAPRGWTLPGPVGPGAAAGALRRSRGAAARRACWGLGAARACLLAVVDAAMPYEAAARPCRAVAARDRRAVSERKLPPIEHWNPAEIGDSQMRIAADGALVPRGRPDHPPGDGPRLRLAADARRRRAALAGHARVPPVDRGRGRGVRRRRHAGATTARSPSASTPTNWCIAGPDHPLRAAGDPETPAIYLAVRHGCEARLDRSTWLQLAEHRARARRRLGGRRARARRSRWCPHERAVRPPASGCSTRATASSCPACATTPQLRPARDPPRRGADRGHRPRPSPA